MISADLMALLRCPQTRQPLAPAGPKLLAEVNARLEKARDTSSGNDILEAALVREDGTALYPVVNEIPLLLAEYVILL